MEQNTVQSLVEQCISEGGRKNEAQEDDGGGVKFEWTLYGESGGRELSTAIGEGVDREKAYTSNSSRRSD